jgi:hypothetical protein
MPNRPSVTPAFLEEYCTKFRNWGRWGPEDELGRVNFLPPHGTRPRRGLMLTTP